ncbi:hypothetical protein QTP88_029755 [Uroleucon formosanum]
MESSIPNSSTSSAKSVALNYEMDSSNEEIDQHVLREAGEQTINAEWSATVSALNSSDTTSSNSYINIETLKECCANPSDTLKDKEDFMVFESSSTVVNISKFNDTKYNSEYKTTAFQKKHKPLSQNVSRCFENILDDDSQMEITQNSICLNRFQKRKRLIPPNDEDFIEINNSNYSGSNRLEVSIMKSPKFCFSREKRDQFEIPDYNLSATDSDSIANDTNISKRKENASNCSLVINDSSDNMKNASKTEVFAHKFSLKTIDVGDSVFENIINNSSIVSDITLNKNKTSLNETVLSNVNNTSSYSKVDLSNLNHTYDIPNNTNCTSVKASIAGDADVPKVNHNTVFKKPNLSILVNNSSNNIMDVSKTEVLTQKFSRKSIGVSDSAFDNIINDSSMTSNIGLNNIKTSFNETSVSNINNSKMDMSNLNYTYDIPTNINTSKSDIVGEANKPKVKQNTDLKKPSNPSKVVNNSSNNIIDLSKTEVLTHKFSRKTIDVADSVFDNIINDSSIISDITLNHNHTSSNEMLMSNVNNPVLNKIDMSNLNHTYDIPTNTNTSKTDVSIAGDANLPKVKQNTDLKKPTNPSKVVNNSSNNIMDVSKPEVFTHKFSRKTIDVTHSVFDNIINNSSMTSDIALYNKKASFINTSVSNENTPVFSTTDICNSNHVSDIPMNNNTTILDAIVEHDKNVSESPVSLQNRSKSFNLLPLKFNFRNKFGRHSLSLQENNPSFDVVKQHNISLNTDFSKNSEEESNTFHKSNNSKVNLKSYPHFSIIREIPPLDDQLLTTNTLNQEQLESKRSISSNSNNKDFLSSNTTTKSLESNEFQNNQSKRSMSSTSSNEGLTLLNSTTGLLESCSSSRTQSRLLTSKQSKNSTSNNDTFNLTIESLDSNESQNDQSEHLMSSTSNNEDLTLTNSTTKYSGRRSSSRNKSTSSEHSISVVSNNVSVASSSDSYEISVGGRSSRNRSKHSTSVISNNDNLTLLNTTMESLKSNESLKTQSRGSISPTSYNESLKSTNSTTESSGKRSSSQNKSSSISSKHSTSVVSNNVSVALSNDSYEISVGGRSSRNRSKHSTSVISNNDNLTLLNTTMESLKSNESLKTQSRGSISPISYNENLKSTNSTTESSGRHSLSRNKSSLLTSKHSTSVISNNDDLTLLNTTMESLKSNESLKTQSRGSIGPTSYNESLKSTNSTESSGKCSSSRNKSTSSEHSTSVISNNVSVALSNDSKEISMGGRSSRNQSKHSTSAISNNDNLTLLNTTTESLKSNESQKTQSKRSISPTSYNESLKSINSTTGSSGKRSSSRNKSTSSEHSTSVVSNNVSVALSNDSKEISMGGRSSRNRSKHSTNVISNNDNLMLLNTTTKSLKNNESQKIQSKRSISPNPYNESLKSTNSTTGSSGKHSSSRNKSLLLTSKLSTSVISNHDSLPLLNAVTSGSLESNEFPKTQLTCPTLNIENLTPLNNTTKSFKQNGSISKHSSLINSGKTPINALILEDVSRMSTRSSKRKSNCSINVEPITSICIDGLSNTDGLTIKNTTGPLVQKILSINQSNSSPNISTNTSTNGLILEDDTNNISKMYASSTKQKNQSYDDIEQVMPDITDGPLVENRPSKTRVLRSSLRINKNKSLPTKSLTSENDVNNLSIDYIQTSKNISNFNNETFDNNSDNSLFWTTLPDDSTNISSMQNVNMNTFQTPKRNKLSIAENIVNTIKIMSTNKQKSTHPGAFELDDQNDGPLTRSLVTRSCNRSPSILTLVFGGQKTLESTSLLTHSPSEFIFDQSQVEENVKQKFKSLYKKESWITKRLYKFLIIKLQPNYNIYSVKYAEKFIKYLAQLLKQILKDQVNFQLCTDMLRYHMARYHIIKDTFDYLGFLSDYIPMEYYKKLVPGWNLETSAVKFDPQKYYIPLMDDEEFLNYIMEHLNEA